MTCPTGKAPLTTAEVRKIKRHKSKGKRVREYRCRDCGRLHLTTNHSWK